MINHQRYRWTQNQELQFRQVIFTAYVAARAVSQSVGHPYVLLIHRHPRPHVHHRLHQQRKKMYVLNN